MLLLDAQDVILYQLASQFDHKGSTAHKVQKIQDEVFKFFTQEV